MSDPIISIQNLYKIFGPNAKGMLKEVEKGSTKQEILDNYGHVLALNNINLEIESNRIQIIMGLSGSGKSTLIRHINRLIEPTYGNLFVASKNVLEMNPADLRDLRRFKISMVFQNFALLPHRTILDNIAYGLSIQNNDKELIKEKSKKWLDRVGLTGFEEYYPGQMSGGMQQRVGLARALATDADILLMDEPFSALDPLIRTDMQEILLGLQEELKKTIVFITHDLNEGLRVGDKIAILKDGVIVQNGSPEQILLNPSDKYVTAFTKDINRGKILLVSSLMTPVNSIYDQKIDQSMTIEEAIILLSDEKQDIATVVNEGESVGTVTLGDMISALVKSEKK